MAKIVQIIRRVAVRHSIGLTLSSDPFMFEELCQVQYTLMNNSSGVQTSENKFRAFNNLSPTNMTNYRGVSSAIGSCWLVFTKL